MNYFCTYFDSNYLIKGLTLYRSLVKNAHPFRLWVLCLDTSVYEVLKKLKLPEVVPISLGEFEAGDQDLQRVKPTRSRVEYYFTLTPSLVLGILKKYPEIDVITYLDADLFFFSDPLPIFQELGENSIVIIEHRFAPSLRRMEVFGIYNVGWISFRADPVGKECLEWWRNKCLDWCGDQAEPGRFADQKYLDDWPQRFARVSVLQHKGANLAPWNLGNYCLRLNHGQVEVDSQPLIFFHFHRFNRVGNWLYDSNLDKFEVSSRSIIRRNIYGVYLRNLRETERWLSVSGINISGEINFIRESISLEPKGWRDLIKKIIKGSFLISLGKWTI